MDKNISMEKNISIEKNIYINTILKKRIILRSEYINKNFLTNIEKLLKDEVGDKCIKEGYINANSIKIIKRSIAKIISSNFSGDLAIDINYYASVCNPVRGNVIVCKIIRINKLGVQAENFPLSVIVAKQYHNNKDIFKNLKVGQIIDVLVIGKRYSLNDKIIEVVGKLTTDKDINKTIKIRKLKSKNKELTNIFDEKGPDESVAEGELESIDEESQFSEEEEEGEENISDVEQNLSADEEDDMLESDLEEQVTEEENVEDFE